MHFKTRDGFDVYVGRNNIMNDKLTMKTAKIMIHGFTFSQPQATT